MNNHTSRDFAQAKYRNQLDGVPIIHGVLLFENEAQAKVRCLGKEHSRGIEAAQVALEMTAVMQSLP